jgi:hypothetical protein
MSCVLKQNLKFSHKNFSHFSLFHLDPFYSFVFSPSIFGNILKKFFQQFSFHFHFLGQLKEHWLFNVLFLELFGAWKIYRQTLSLLLISIILWFSFVHCLTFFRKSSFRKFIFMFFIDCFSRWWRHAKSRVKLSKWELKLSDLFARFSSFSWVEWEISTIFSKRSKANFMKNSCIILLINLNLMKRKFE